MKRLLEYIRNGMSQTNWFKGQARNKHFEWGDWIVCLIAFKSTATART
jgi:hypothetical protein